MTRIDNYKYSGGADTVTHVFGPVPSRRLGLSLGVDIVPFKTCSYDCLYCQVGKTTCLSAEPRALVSLEAVMTELKQSLERITPDVVTFSGSGEPTLHSGIGEAIAFVKAWSDLRVAVLTNGSLLWRGEVRERLLAADVIMPTLNTVNEDTYRKIHRPHPELHLPRVIQGLESLRKVYKGRLDVEVVLLAGLNDSPEELAGLKKVLMAIDPDRIQLNTVVRPPADARALALDREKMEEVKTFFGKRAEIIAFTPPKQRDQNYDSLTVAVMEMAKRRPVRAVDVSQVLGLSTEEVEMLVKGLVVKGHLQSQVYLGDTYYLSGKRGGRQGND
jgi:wyosine [tRNA(Phe)-imidazoG37] synthetase (radical SAM superfamily)